MYAILLKTKTTIMFQWKKLLYIHNSLLYNTFIIVLQTLYKLHDYNQTNKQKHNL